MAINRADLRLAVREILREFYDLDTIATGGISSSAVTLPVTTVTRYKIGDVLQIGSEFMKVEAIDQDNSQLTVQRAFRGSTAAAHLAAVQIYIVPEVTDRMLNYAINFGIANTFANRELGDMGIWFDVVDTSLTTLITTREYTIPTGFATTHFIIEVQDGNGNYLPNNAWHISGTKIVFHADFPVAGYIIRITGMGYQPQLSDDTTNFTLADEQVEVVKIDAALHILEMRLGPRIKATEYSASVNDRAGQPNDMVVVLGHLKNRFASIRARESKPMKSTYLERPRR